MGEPSEKSLRMCSVGPGEHGPSRRQALLGQAMMHISGRQQAEARVMVLSVVPGEEDVNGCRWEHAGARVGLGHAKIGEQEGNGLRENPVSKLVEPRTLAVASTIQSGPPQPSTTRG
jgi:hypothetical protein